MNAKFLIRNFNFLITLLVAVLFALPVKAQVTIGEQVPPQPFSILELITSQREGGLRLPQLNNAERIAVQAQFNTSAETAKSAKGLVIYNTEDGCVEYWNGSRWVSLCKSVCPAITCTVSPASGSAAVSGTVQLTAAIDPSNAPSITYQWECSLDGISWAPVQGATAATYNAPAMLAGITQYRVTATNYCGDNISSNVASITGTGAMPTPPANLKLYVGAFWKANQTGERLIRVTRTTSGADGAWTASVVSGADWILLDTLMTSDPNVGWRTGAVEANVISGNDSGFETNPNFQPKNNLSASATVTGTMDATNTQIYFRIGLKNVIAAGEHRYGVVLLTYRNNNLSQLIFIRQGEDADYVMRNSDPVSTGGLATRTQCKPFSPYNLTAATLNAQVGLNGAGPNPGIFTQYPTQTGAFFQWAVTAPNNIRYAFDPSTIGVPAGVTWNTASVLPNYFWSSLVSTYETCPAGYRRPTDGSISNSADGSDISLSEMRQSLWLNPQQGTSSPDNLDNSEGGYYADGFFDRRNPVNSIGGYAGTLSTVSASNDSIAHTGRLFFNPTTNASLFFPAAGYRAGNNVSLVTAGYLYYSGSVGYFFSSSIYNSSLGTYNALILSVAGVNATSPSNVACIVTSAYTNAMPVRCVKN